VFLIVGAVPVTASEASSDADAKLAIPKEEGFAMNQLNKTETEQNENKKDQLEETCTTLPDERPDVKLTVRNEEGFEMNQLNFSERKEQLEETSTVMRDAMADPDDQLDVQDEGLEMNQLKQHEPKENINEQLEETCIGRREEPIIDQQEPSEEPTVTVGQEPAEELTVTVGQEPAEELTVAIIDQEPSEELTVTFGQEPSEELTVTVGQEPSEELTVAIIDQEPSEELTVAIIDQEPSEELTVTVGQEPSEELTVAIIDQEPSEELTATVGQETSEELTAETDLSLESRVNYEDILVRQRSVSSPAHTAQKWVTVASHLSQRINVDQRRRHFTVDRPIKYESLFIRLVRENSVAGTSQTVTTNENTTSNSLQTSVPCILMVTQLIFSDVLMPQLFIVEAKTGDRQRHQTEQSNTSRDLSS
jgi:hypothetical protein